MKLYIIDNTINVNILESQHLTPLRLNKNNDYIIICPIKHENLLNELGFQNQVQYYSTNLEKYLCICKSKNIRDIYTRSIIDFFWILLLKTILLKKWILVFDFRGLSSEESKLKGMLNVKVLLLKCLEWIAFNFSNRLYTVSHKFKIYLETKYIKKKSITVIPCCVVNSQLVSKSYFTIGDKLNFVYVGGLSSWQKFDYILKVYSEISAKLNANLTVITSEVSHAEEIIKVKGVKATVFQMDHKDISQELKKYDFGFILRDNILLNNLASPVKFLEYISNGVIPIISDNIGDYSELCKNKKIGVVETLNINRMIEDIIEIKNDIDIQLRLHNVAKEYTWEKYLDKMF